MALTRATFDGTRSCYCDEFTVRLLRLGYDILFSLRRVALGPGPTLAGVGYVEILLWNRKSTRMVSVVSHTVAIGAACEPFQ